MYPDGEALQGSNGAVGSIKQHPSLQKVYSLYDSANESYETYSQVLQESIRPVRYHRTPRNCQSVGVPSIMDCIKEMTEELEGRSPELGSFQKGLRLHLYTFNFILAT